MLHLWPPENKLARAWGVQVRPTLPPRWPHFFSEDSWSSKCTPAAPALIIDFMSSKQLSGPPKPASASATMGAYQSTCMDSIAQEPS